MIRLLLLPLALSLYVQVLPGPSHAETASSARTKAMSESLSAIRTNLDSWLAAFNAKDIDALLALYDDETVYANANAPIISGKEAIRARYSATFAAVRGTLKFKEEHAFAEESMGLIVGKYYFQPPAGEADPKITGRVALVYRKQADGRWGLLFDMDNTPPDISPVDFQ